jgi:hypothetical protein
MSVQLILYPQVYDGYYSYLSGNTTSQGANQVTGNGTNVQPFLTPLTVPQILGNPNFAGTNNGTITNIGNGNGTREQAADNQIALRTNAAPVGQWRLSYTDGQAEPSILGGKLTLDIDGTEGGSSFAYTTVDGLQAGNSYRVLITIDSAPAGANITLGNSGTAEWEQSKRDNGLARIGQVGGAMGTVEAREDFINASTGVNIGQPLRLAVNTPTRYYQNFIARSSQAVLQVNFAGNVRGQAVISTVSLVAAPNNFPNNININNGGASAASNSANSSATTFINDGQVILDLYKDESIPLNLSVDDFTKVDEKIASYSKSFMIPATKHNNKIFSFYFDVTRSQNHDVFFFNPFAKTKAKIKDKTVLVFEGWMKLINVQIKNGQISYNINLYSEPTTFCDYLKAGVMADIDLSELQHDYITGAEVAPSWDNTIGLPLTAPLSTNSYAYDPALGVNNTNVLKYPMINWAGQFELTNPNLINMGYPENVFRPVINCKYLLDRMFEATPFTYESTFLDGAIFKKCFMDYNYSGDSGMMAASFIQTDQKEFAIVSTGAWENLILPITTGESPVGTALQHFNNATGLFTMQLAGDVMTTGQPRFYRNFFNTEAEWRMEKVEFTTGIVSYPVGNSVTFNAFAGAGVDCNSLNGTAAPIVAASEAQCGAGYAAGTWQVITMQPNDTLQLQFRKSAGGGEVWLSTNEQINTWEWSNQKSIFNDKTKQVFSYTVLGGQSTIAFLQQGIRAQLKQYDFWKGIKQMFNLVTMPDKDNPNNLIIEPYADIFLNNPNTKQLDWTNKVDQSNIKIQPLNKLPKSTTFGYVEDPNDYRVKQYKNALGGYIYGSKTYEAGEMFFSLLTGEKKITAKPFAPTITAPLTMLFPDFIMSHIYKGDDTGTAFSPFANKPRILFDEGIKPMPLGANGLIVEAAVLWLWGFGAILYQEYGSMSHLDITPTGLTTQDLNFGECPLVQPVGASPVDNLFNTYWLPYYAALYNPDCRSVKMKMKLTPADINEFNFWDVILVQNRVYRINKIQYSSNLLATVELILIP